MMPNLQKEREIARQNFTLPLRESGPQARRGPSPVENPPWWTAGRSWLMALGLLCVAGCLGTSEKEVVVYAALDKEFSEPILKDFEISTGIKVLPKYDQESNKTVGLANEIINQQQRQRADCILEQRDSAFVATQKTGVAGSLRKSPGPALPARVRLG